MSVWKLAQSNVAGCRARFLIGVCGQCSTISKDLLDPNNLVPRGQYNGYVKALLLQKHAQFRHRKQESLQPSLVALFKRCKQTGSRGFGFVRTSAEKGVETINQGVELVNR